MSSNNDSYYEKFMGFFGGAKNFPAIKLYIHALFNLKSKVVPSNNLCDTFLCNLNAGRTIGNLPYDLSVFIHHIYRDLLSPATVNSQKDEIINAVKYVGSLYNGTSFDINIADRLAMIVQDHATVMSDTTSITTNPKDWGRTADVIMKPGLPAYIAQKGAGTPVVTLANMLNTFDIEKPTAEYQRILAKKVSFYNLSLYEMKQLALSHVSNAVNTNKGSPASYWQPKPSGPSSTVGYYRKEADPSKLYKLVKDASGNKTETEVQAGSKYHTDVMSKPATCNDIHGVNAVDNDSCTRFVMDCLMGDKKGMDDDRCKNTLKNSKFWENTKKEVFEDMLPDVACSILDSFGFQKVRVTNPNGKSPNTINEYEDKGLWLARLNKNFSSDYDPISKNTNLMSYLDMLLNKVNGSPAILNTNYYSKSPNNINRFGSSWLGQRGISGANTGNNSNFVSVGNLASVLGSNLASTKLAFGLSPIIQPIIVMRGGNINMSIQQRASQSVPSSSWVEQAQKSSPILKEALHFFNSELGKINREIDETDFKALLKSVEDLENSETLLQKNVLLMHEYLNIMLNFDNQSEMNKNETLDNIKKFVESSGKRINKIEKGSNNLIVALQKLSNALDISVNGKQVLTN
jgi:hypothetical protein